MKDQHKFAKGDRVRLNWLGKEEGIRKPRTDRKDISHTGTIVSTGRRIRSNFTHTTVQVLWDGTKWPHAMSVRFLEKVEAKNDDPT